jgi:hypothetical protein
MIVSGSWECGNQVEVEGMEFFCTAKQKKGSIMANDRPAPAKDGREEQSSTPWIV